jgi:hypothetical protein
LDPSRRLANTIDRRRRAIRLPDDAKQVTAEATGVGQNDREGGRRSSRRIRRIATGSTNPQRGLDRKRMATRDRKVLALDARTGQTRRHEASMPEQRLVCYRPH